MSDAISLKCRSPSPGDSEYQIIDKLGNEVLDARTVFEKAAAGDELATKIVEETAEHLAILCINICRVIDPATIFFAGKF